MLVKKYNRDTKTYSEPFECDSLGLASFDVDMDQIVECPSCHNKVRLGDTYNSGEYYDINGVFAVPICEHCYKLEQQFKTIKVCKDDAIVCSDNDETCPLCDEELEEITEDDLLADTKEAIEMLTNDELLLIYSFAHRRMDATRHIQITYYLRHSGFLLTKITNSFEVWKNEDAEVQVSSSSLQFVVKYSKNKKGINQDIDEILTKFKHNRTTITVINN